MALFGSNLKAPDPNAMGWADKLNMLGAAFRDAGNPDSNGANVANIQQVLLARQQQQRLAQANQALTGLFGGSAPTPDHTQGGAFVPPELRAPAAAGPSITDPVVQRKLLAIQQAGGNIGSALEMLKASKAPDPHWQYGPGGDAFNASADQAPGHASDMIVLGDQLVDKNNRGNENLVAPKAPVPGAMPVYNNLGRVVDWTLPAGAQAAIGAAAQSQSGGAEAGKAPFVAGNAYAQASGSAAGQAPYEMIDVPMPDGSSIKMSKAQFLAVQAHAAGLAGAPQTGVAAPGGAAPAGLGQTQTPGNKTYAEGQAKASQEQYQALQTAGTQALGVIPKYQRLGELLDGYNGNKLSPLGTEMAQYMRAIPGLGNFDAKLPNKEAAIALTNQLALQLRDPSQGGGMPGALSNSDRDFLVKSVPNLAQTAQGRKMMVDSAVKLNQRNADVAGMARKWQQRYGRLDAVNPATGKSFQDNLMDWSGRNPLFGGAK